MKHVPNTHSIWCEWGLVNIIKDEKLTVETFTWTLFYNVKERDCFLPMDVSAVLQFLSNIDILPEYMSVIFICVMGIISHCKEEPWSKDAYKLNKCVMQYIIYYKRMRRNLYTHLNRE